MIDPRAAAHAVWPRRLLLALSMIGVIVVGACGFGAITWGLERAIPDERLDDDTEFGGRWELLPLRSFQQGDGQPDTSPPCRTRHIA